jgi:hypothetical protein
VANARGVQAGNGHGHGGEAICRREEGIYHGEEVTYRGEEATYHGAREANGHGVGVMQRSGGDGPVVGNENESGMGNVSPRGNGNENRGGGGRAVRGTGSGR